MIKYKYIDKLRDKNNKITHYILEDSNGMKANVKAEVLRHHMKIGNIQIDKLKLTSDGRIINNVNKIKMDSEIFNIDFDKLDTFVDNFSIIATKSNKERLIPNDIADSIIIKINDIFGIDISPVRGFENIQFRPYFYKSNYFVLTTSGLIKTTPMQENNIKMYNYEFNTDCFNKNNEFDQEDFKLSLIKTLEYMHMQSVNVLYNTNYVKALINDNISRAMNTTFLTGYTVKDFKLDWEVTQKKFIRCALKYVGDRQLKNKDNCSLMLAFDFNAKDKKYQILFSIIDRKVSQERTYKVKDYDATSINEMEVMLEVIREHTKKGIENMIDNLV